MFLGFPDLSSSKIFDRCSATICRSRNADSLAVEDAMFSFLEYGFQCRNTVSMIATRGAGKLVSATSGDRETPR